MIPRLITGKSHPFPHEYALWIGGLLLTFAVTIALARLALRILSEAEAEAGRDPAPLVTVDLKR